MRLLREEVKRYLFLIVYPSDDFPPRRLPEEPIATGSARGEGSDRGCYDQMLTEYYRLRGWDAETGIPSNEKQQELGLI
jgi:aldehyde:ferredoxin oxidoreductase